MNNYKIKPSYVALAIASALTTNITFAQATLDTSPKMKDTGLERIEVTARRTVENLQTVPLSVTSIGAADIAENGITDVTDIQQYAVNTTLQVSRGSNSTLTAYIRGIGQQDPLWGYEPGVGVYVDDVYIARPQGGVMEILDVQRIEILRGPQGTLYGKNTIGGAMKYITKKMSGDNTFDVSATVGNYGLNTYKAAGQLSLLNNKLYIGGAFADVNRGGFGTFINNTDITTLPGISATPEASESAGADNYNKDLVAGRFNIEYHVTDDLFFRLAYDKTVDDSNAKGGRRLVASKLIADQMSHENNYDSDTSLPTYNKVATSGVSLTMDWNLNDNFSFKSITASREGDSFGGIDFDNTVLKSFDVIGVYEDNQFTQEFQLSYVGEGIAAVGGLYYYTGEACGVFDVQLEVLGNILGAPGLTSESGGCTDTDSYSAYGQASFDLSDKWSLTLGGRYTQDSKDAEVYKYTFYQTVYPEDYENGVVAAPVNPGNSFNGEQTWSHFSPRVGVEYQGSEDMMLYASYANGFKSGGYNMRGDLGADPEAAAPFDPEIVDTFEVGVKSEPTDDIRINATYFYSDYQDMQVTVQHALSADNFVARVLNAGQAEIQGVELESIYAAIDNLTIKLSLGYIDAKFVEFLTADPSTGEPVDVAEQLDIANTPQWTVNLGANYTIDADIGDFIFTANAAYRSDTQIFETPSVIDEEAYTLVNVGVTYYHTDGNWSASLQGRNIFDQQVRIAGYNFRGLGGEDSIIGYFNNPATVALTLKYEF